MKLSVTCNFYELKNDFKDFAEVEGSKVISVISLDQYKKIIDDNADVGRLLVVDHYATWCPPCKASAPIFALLSKGFLPFSHPFSFIMIMQNMMRPKLYS